MRTFYISAHLCVCVCVCVCVLCWGRVTAESRKTVQSHFVLWMGFLWIRIGNVTIFSWMLSFRILFSNGVRVMVGISVWVISGYAQVFIKRFVVLVPYTLCTWAECLQGVAGDQLWKVFFVCCSLSALQSANVAENKNNFTTQGHCYWD